MKKYLLIFLIIITTIIISCKQGNDIQNMQSQLNRLQDRVDKSYKPGLGDFMSSIQVHHEKLWFAGENKNWPLAHFEIDEIKEMITDIQAYCIDRPEIKSIPMINPAVDSLSNAIDQKNAARFKSGFVLLTSTCNNCHHATQHSFNVIRIPDTPPFSNQDFKPQ